MQYIVNLSQLRYQTRTHSAFIPTGGADTFLVLAPPMADLRPVLLGISVNMFPGFNEGAATRVLARDVEANAITLAQQVAQTNTEMRIWTIEWPLWSYVGGQIELQISGFFEEEPYSLNWAYTYVGANDTIDPADFDPSP